MRNYAAPRPERQTVMRAIRDACAVRPHSTPELAALVHSTPGSVAVLIHRMRRYGQITTIQPGTRSARHVAATGGGDGRSPANQEQESKQ